MIGLTLGRVIIRWDAQCCSVFSGRWQVGRWHQFEWAHLYEVQRQTAFIGLELRNSRVIVLVADGIFEFGGGLADDQRALIIAILLGKGTLPSAFQRPVT